MSFLFSVSDIDTPPFFSSNLLTLGQCHAENDGISMPNRKEKLPQPFGSPAGLT
jgi:hypothetical protein